MTSQSPARCCATNWRLSPASRLWVRRPTATTPCATSPVFSPISSFWIYRCPAWADSTSFRSELAALSGVEIVGEAANGNDALRDIARLQPDLVFLDLQMPRMGGFDVIPI